MNSVKAVSECIICFWTRLFLFVCLTLCFCLFVSSSLCVWVVGFFVVVVLFVFWGGVCFCWLFVLLVFCCCFLEEGYKLWSVVVFCGWFLFVVVFVCCFVFCFLFICFLFFVVFCKQKNNTSLLLIRVGIFLQITLSLSRVYLRSS